MKSRYSLSRIFSSTHTTTTVLLLLTICCQFASLVTADDEPESRVVGGSNADLNEYPFFTSWGSSCGATLIHDDILLTAAHVSYEKYVDSFLSALMTGQVYINFLNGF